MTPAEKTRILAERVMGWEIYKEVPEAWLAYDDQGNLVRTFATFEPLTNLSHAGEVLEAMAKKGWSARIATNALAAFQNGCELYKAYLGLGRNMLTANYEKYGPDRRVFAVAPTIATAICHAALQAHEVKEEEL